MLIYKTPKEDIWYSLTIAVVWGFIGFIITELFRFHFTYKKELEEWVNKKFEKIIEFIAVSTKNGKFESVLKKLRDPQLGNLRWALAKFVSHRLYRSFENEEKEIVIEKVTASEYSELLSELMSECRKSIYLTCPRTPKEWFKILNFEICNNCDDGASCKKDKIILYEIKNRSPHLVTFFNSNVVEKIRLVNIEDSKFNFFTESKNLRCIKNFITYYENNTSKTLTKDHNILVKIVKQSELNPHNDPSVKDIVSGDFNVLDEKIVMMWNEYQSEPGIGECKLILDPIRVEQYSKIFQKNKTSDDRDIEKIIERLSGGKDNG